MGRTVPTVVAAVLLSLAATHAGTIDAGPYATSYLAVITLSLGLALAGAWRRRRTVGAAGWLIAAALACALVGNAGWPSWSGPSSGRAACWPARPAPMP